VAKIQGRYPPIHAPMGQDQLGLKTESNTLKSEPDKIGPNKPEIQGK